MEKLKQDQSELSAKIDQISNNIILMQQAQPIKKDVGAELMQKFQDLNAKQLLLVNLV